MRHRSTANRGRTLILRVFGYSFLLQDNDGSTPLHYAAMCEHIDLISFLLSAGADASIEDEAGESAEKGIREIKDLPPPITAALENTKNKAD
jgi:hypothetical protein